MRLLLISNSASPGEHYLESSSQDIANFLSGCAENVVFIPYAAVTFSYDEYVGKVNKALEVHQIQVKGLHTYPNPIEAVSNASAIMVGGGNTFQLLKKIQELGVDVVIAERCKNQNIPYLGWSAGANIASPTIGTTNDMPIVSPSGFSSLGLVPFQINPHYLDAHPKGHGGETREQRILEYIALNPKTDVVGLREGSRLLIKDNELSLLGKHTIRLFKHGHLPKELSFEDNINFLLQKN